MRIAQIAPLTESVPPKLYGGTERVVSYLTEALVELGHEVTLFASGDSQTAAKLDAVWPQALRLDTSIRDRIAPHMLLMERVARRAHEFDVLHFHMDYYSFSLFQRQPTPFVTTLHGRLDLLEQVPTFEGFPQAPLVSISQSQRQPMPRLNWLATILHGLPEHLYTPQPVEPRYLAFIGRISPEKRVDIAIPSPRAAGCRSVSRPRSTMRTASISSAASGRCSRCRTSSSSARSTITRRPRSCPARTRCCSRSTGPSRSASS